MKLTIAHTFASSPERVFAALVDPAVLQRCIDGCEKLVKTGEDAYEVQLKVGAAGIKGSYGGKVQITSKQPPESMTLSMEGKGAGGFVRMTANIRLAPKGTGTELTGDADATVGGIIAAVGSRLIEAVAKKMMSDFYGRLDADLTSRPAS
jgi:uncharacterized protein